MARPVRRSTLMSGVPRRLRRSARAARPWSRRSWARRTLAASSRMVSGWGGIRLDGALASEGRDWVCDWRAHPPRVHVILMFILRLIGREAHGHGMADGRSGISRKQALWHQMRERAMARPWPQSGGAVGGVRFGTGLRKTPTRPRSAISGQAPSAASGRGLRGDDGVGDVVRHGPPGTADRLTTNGCSVLDSLRTGSPRTGA